MSDRTDYIEEQLNEALQEIERLEKALEHGGESQPAALRVVGVLTSVMRLHHGVIVRLDAKINKLEKGLS